MKFKIVLYLFLVAFTHACGEKCDKENILLKNKIAELEQQLQLNSSSIDKYEKQLQNYKTKDDSLKMFRDSIDILANKIRSSGKANVHDNKAMNDYMNEIRRILSENKKLTEDLSQFINRNDLGQNPALVVKILAQNLENKEREIIDLQNQITELQKEVKGLKIEITSISQEKQLV